MGAAAGEDSAQLHGGQSGHLHRRAAGRRRPAPRQLGGTARAEGPAGTCTGLRESGIRREHHPEQQPGRRPQRLVPPRALHALRPRRRAARAPSHGAGIPLARRRAAQREAHPRHQPHADVDGPRADHHRQAHALRHLPGLRLGPRRRAGERRAAVHQRRRSRRQPVAQRGAGPGARRAVVRDRRRVPRRGQASEPRHDLRPGPRRRRRPHGRRPPGVPGGPEGPRQAPQEAHRQGAQAGRHAEADGRGRRHSEGGGRRGGARAPGVQQLPAGRVHHAHQHGQRGLRGLLHQ
uniref:Uncharacterized protein n=1 Tax=Arundo donax TaxID=35708 RepID=A0A0A9DVK4_ARUDO